MSQPLIAPTLNLNGTPAAELLDTHLRVREAVLQLGRVASEAAPHDRDYYPQGKDAMRKAAGEFQSISSAIDTIASELEWLADPAERGDHPVRVTTDTITVPATPGVLPSIHLNGTAPRVLKDAAKDVFLAADAAREAFRHITPNARDYDSTENWDKARQQHSRRVQTVAHIRDYFLAVAKHCKEGMGGAGKASLSLSVAPEPPPPAVDPELIVTIEVPQRRRIGI